MASEAEAVIYLANKRGRAETDWFRSFYTFNFGEFSRDGSTPFGSLFVVNEHTLKEGRTLSFTFTEKVNVLLLPIEGELKYKSGNVENAVDVGQVACIVSSPGVPLQLSNHYTSRLINFLQICIRADDKVQANLNDTYSFDLESGNGEFIPLRLSSITLSDERFYIGKFRGRHKVVFRTRRDNMGIFVYEITGTCEVHERLLLPGDALSIKRIDVIELEALTQEAIVLVAEIPLPTTN
jgi:quercetin 2,3-dioxygenase